MPDGGYDMLKAYIKKTLEDLIGNDWKTLNHNFNFEW